MFNFSLEFNVKVCTELFFERSVNDRASAEVDEIIDEEAKIGDWWFYIDDGAGEDTGCIWKRQ